jgi:PAS domain S-box-containing protein
LSVRLHVAAGNIAAYGLYLKPEHSVINDLVTLLAFPAMWTGHRPSEIVGSFAESLLALLRVEMVYVRLTAELGAPAQCLRVSHGMQAQSAEVGESLTALGNEPGQWPRQLTLGTGGQFLSIEPVRLGLNAPLGFLVAGSQRADFPVQTDQVLLQVAANQLVVALHEAQQRRVGEEARLRQVIDCIPNIAWCNLTDGSNEFLNKAWGKYTGMAPEDSTGWAWVQAMHPDDLPKLMTRWMGMLHSGEPGEIECRLRRHDGVYRWFLIRAEPFLDEAGRLSRWYGTSTDIDDRKQAEEALRADVEDRKQAEEALSKARTELATVARVTSLGVLTAAIAHEVNQPISGIITNASTCLRMLSAQPPNIEGALETARRNIRDGKRAADVIARLRTLYTKRDVQPEPMDLNEAAREVVSLSLSELQRNGVILRHELAEDLPPVKGDRIQLQQVILNLLRNGSDAMSTVEDRPRELLIGTEPDVEGRVRLSVKDAGVGFSADAAARVFEPFYTTKSEGMGIGLSVSRSIIEAHGGTLWVTRNEGPGVTFAFSLPSA